MALAQVHQRQGAFVVAEQHRQRAAALLHAAEQPGELILPAGCPHHFQRALGTAHSGHRLGAAVTVAGRKAVGRRHDLPAGTVVLFHQKHLRPGPGLFKLHQGLGPGGPETVDALVLVPHQEQVAVFPGQQADDLVLDARGILGFVHAEVTVLLPEPGPHRRHGPQDLQGVDHLVVVVHPALALEFRLVAAVKAGQVGQAGLQRRDALLVQHAVFDVGDDGAQFFQRALGGVVAADAHVQLGQQAGQLPLVGDQAGLLAAIAAAVILQHHRRQAVDGAEGHACGRPLPEAGGKAAAHLPGGGHGVGHRQDLFGRDAAALHHVPQAGHQHRGLAASRHGQQQHRAFHGGRRRQLLRVEAGQILPDKGFLLQGAGPPLRGIFSARSRAGGR